MMNKENFDFEALANEPLDMVAQFPYTFTRNENSYYTLNRFESQTDDFQSLEDLFRDKKVLQEGIQEDDEILEKLRQNILQVAEHKKQLEGYLAECVDDIKMMNARIPAIPSLMLVKDYKIVQTGEYFYEKSRRIVYRLFSFFYDSEGRVITSKLIRDDIPASEIKAIVDEYMESGKISKVEYFDGLRLEKKTVDKWIRKYLAEGKIEEVK